MMTNDNCDYLPDSCECPDGEIINDLMRENDCLKDQVARRSEELDGIRTAWDFLRREDHDDPGLSGYHRAGTCFFCDAKRKLDSLLGLEPYGKAVDAPAFHPEDYAEEWKCKICGAIGFPTQLDLDDHVEWNHGGCKETELPVPDEPDAEKCLVCGRSDCEFLKSVRQILGKEEKKPGCFGHYQYPITKCERCDYVDDCLRETGGGE